MNTAIIKKTLPSRFFVNYVFNNSKNFVFCNISKVDSGSAVVEILNWIKKYSESLSAPNY